MFGTLPILTKIVLLIATVFTRQTISTAVNSQLRNDLTLLSQCFSRSQCSVGLQALHHSSHRLHVRHISVYFDSLHSFNTLFNTDNLLEFYINFLAQLQYVSVAGNAVNRRIRPDPEEFKENLQPVVVEIFWGLNGTNYEGILPRLNL